MHALAKPMPPGARGTVDVIGLSTQPTAGLQPSWNAPLPTATVVDSAAGPPVMTVAEQVTVSQQLLELGHDGLDQQLLPKLVLALSAGVEDVLLNDNTVGLRTVATSTVAYTDATPTLAEFWPNLEALVRKIEIGYGGQPIIAMAPRRLSWIRQQAVAEQINVNFEAPTLPGATCKLLGGPNLIADGTIPTNISTNQDVIVVVRDASAVDLWVSEPIVTVSVAPNSNLQALITARRYCAVAARLPACVGVLSGTGLAAPTP
jgi:hypothetical protein